MHTRMQTHTQTRAYTKHVFKFTLANKTDFARDPSPPHLPDLPIKVRLLELNTLTRPGELSSSLLAMFPLRATGSAMLLGSSLVLSVWASEGGFSRRDSALEDTAFISEVKTSLQVFFRSVFLRDTALLELFSDGDLDNLNSASLVLLSENGER